MNFIKKGILGLWLVISVIAIPVAAAVTAERDIYIPDTISQQAQETLKQLSARKLYQRAHPLPAPDDLEGWHRAFMANENMDRRWALGVLQTAEVTMEWKNIGGVPVVDIRPKGWKDNGKILIYTHGGAYTMFSAKTTLFYAVPMAKATGLRVISIDYTQAPVAKWQKIQEQVTDVFKALLAQGYTMQDMAMFGDSAGGGLAVSAILNLRDEGLGMPAAVVLFSPWADLTNRGDTAYTLKEADPQLSYSSLQSCALAFADGLALDDPRISPLYADFTRGFSPAMIQDGTKGIFLSTSVRLYQRLRAAGQAVELDVYEGMWHGFQPFDLPEAKTSIARSAEFINKHLLR